MALIYGHRIGQPGPAMNPSALRGVKIFVGLVLLGLAIFFVFHHGIFVLGILAVPGAYLIWDGARKPKGAGPPR